MIRLYLFVEGPTEQTFANTVLRPHFAMHGVALHPAVLIAHARHKDKVHRGGGQRYKPMRDDIERFTRQEAGRDVRFSTMIDLYAIARDFPGLAEAEKLLHLPYDRVKALEKSWYDDQSDRRFIPFIVLHEYETFLFAKPDEFGRFYPNQTDSIRALERIATEKGNIELINDGPQTAPSKRIINEFPQYKRQKATVGPQLAQQIGLPTIRQSCRHFDEWVRQIECLGQPADTDLSSGASTASDDSQKAEAD